MNGDNESWLNREKFVFVVASVLLVWTSVALVRSELRKQEIGPQFVQEDPPPKPTPVDELDNKQPLSSYLIGARGNPFAFRESFYVVGGIERPLEVEIRPRPAVSRPVRRPRQPSRPTTPKVNPGKPPVRPKPTTPPTPTATPEAKPPRKAYELPVNFVGVFIKEDERYALLKDKQTDTYLRLVEGEEYPDLKIKVVRVTKSSVILENEEGKRFMLRDLLRQILAERLQTQQDN